MNCQKREWEIIGEGKWNKGVWVWDGLISVTGAGKGRETHGFYYLKNRWCGNFFERVRWVSTSLSFLSTQNYYIGEWISQKNHQVFLL